MSNPVVLKKRRQYDEDFKMSALKMISSGQSVVSVSQSLGVSEALLYRWKTDQQPKNNPSASPVMEELRMLRQQLKQVEMERDILKKALRIFSLAT